MFQEFFLASPSCLYKNFFWKSKHYFNTSKMSHFDFSSSNLISHSFHFETHKFGGEGTPNPNLVQPQIESRAKYFQPKQRGALCLVPESFATSLLCFFLSAHLLSLGELQMNRNNNHAIIFPAGDKLLWCSGNSEFIDVGPNRPLRVDRA